MGGASGTCRTRPIIFVANQPQLDPVPVPPAPIPDSRSEYTVETPMLRDVVSIELIKAIYPNVNNNSPFLVIKIAGMGSIQSNDNTMRGAFCVLLHNPDPNVLPITYERGGSDRCSCYIHYFDQPVRINQMHIRIEGANGALATPEADPHMFMFEIHTLNQPQLPF